MGDRKQPNPPPGTPGSTAPPQRRPDPPPPGLDLRTHASPRASSGKVHGLGDEVALNSGGPVMTVAGVSDGVIGLRYLCTWTDTAGQAWHDWFGAAALSLLRRAAPPPPQAAQMRHVRCDQPVAVTTLDETYVLWCRTCGEAVHVGDLFPPTVAGTLRVVCAPEVKA